MHSTGCCCNAWHICSGHTCVSKICHHKDLLHAGLAVAAHLFDSTCVSHIGFSLNSISLILMSGFITTAHRQVCMLLQCPRQ